MHTANADTISQFLDDDAFELIVGEPLRRDRLHPCSTSPRARRSTPRARTPPARCSTSTAAGRWPTPSTTSASPRSAAPASCTPANGPFPPGSLGYLEDTGYPEYDPDAGRTSEMDTCLAELGTDSIEFTFNTTNDPFNVETQHADHLDVEEAFGDQVQATITPIEQGQYIGLALTGAFQASGLAQPRRLRPRPAAAVVAERVGRRRSARWRSTSAASRTTYRREPARSSRPTPTRPPARRPPRTINRRFGEQVYNLWQHVDAVGHHRRSRTSTASRRTSCPTAREGIGLAFAGRHQINQIWCDEGACE